MIIGMTGGIGSGKSTAARLFTELGIPVRDADDIAHELTSHDTMATRQIAARLGTDWVTGQGALDRTFARRRVYSNPELKQELESILHPLILQKMRDWISSQTSAYCIVVVPLLFEKADFRALAQRTMLIDCPEELQIHRVMQRSGLSEADVRKIMANQMSRQQRQQLCDDLILNTGSLPELAKQIKTLHDRYLIAAKVRNGFSNA
ncbi:dephospho-CoA kinase [Chitinilyticum aquatile]|uniref:dephospho-CoA kinase n=1 Tax=Chitinilyticum aquatile TaxID=362520 RepID=UPI00040D4F53|nr:dephospho-CoA kinase [Chitinilyticum aquatile]